MIYLLKYKNLYIYKIYMSYIVLILLIFYYFYLLSFDNLLDLKTKLFLSSIMLF